MAVVAVLSVSSLCVSVPDPLECGYRHLALQKAISMWDKTWLPMPWRNSTSFSRDVYDALQLAECPHVAHSIGTSQSDLERRQTNTVTRHSLLVDQRIGDDGSADGSDSKPFRTIRAALARLRATDTSINSEIRLAPGIHFLGSNGTIRLGPKDSGISIVSADGVGTAWLSGGIELSGLHWGRGPRKGIWQVSLAESSAAAIIERTGTIRGLFTKTDHQRYTRARYPNANPETSQWGYSSQNRDTLSFNSDTVAAWHTPEVGQAPQLRYVDFSVLPNPVSKIKNDSSMVQYNTWTEGHGGVCAEMWEGSSYWCSNSSGGGWAEVDSQAAMSGQLQLPVGMTLNFSARMRGPDLNRIRRWNNPEGAVVAAWHSQSWFLNFFTVIHLQH